MTRERRLAVQMWREIAEYLRNSNNDIRLYKSVADLKHRFCDEHNLHWRSDCWFCEYLSSTCKKCPIRYCSDNDSLYGKVCYASQEEAARAADRIADKLEGKK